MLGPIARSIEEVGDGWTLLILRNAYLGARRFADFQERLGIPPNTLTRRLERLVSLGFFTRHRYESRPPREEYELTEKGLALLPILLGPGSAAARDPARAEAPVRPCAPRDVSVGGKSLHFVICAGRRDGPVVLLEAGATLDSTEWTGVTARLAGRTDATIIAYDRAGTGKSQPLDTPPRGCCGGTPGRARGRARSPRTGSGARRRGRSGARGRCRDGGWRAGGRR